jgi:hypothetical protein
MTNWRPQWTNRLAVVFVLVGASACGGRASSVNPAASCNDNGAVHANGSNWTCSDRCNTCSCDNGKIVSALVACLSPHSGTLKPRGALQMRPCPKPKQARTLRMPRLRTAQRKRTYRTEAPRAVRAPFEPPTTTNPAHRIPIRAPGARTGTSLRVACGPTMGASPGMPRCLSARTGPRRHSRSPLLRSPKARKPCACEA